MYRRRISIITYKEMPSQRFAHENTIQRDPILAPSLQYYTTQILSLESTSLVSESNHSEHNE